MKPACLGLMKQTETELHLQAPSDFVHYVMLEFFKKESDKDILLGDVSVSTEFLSQFYHYSNFFHRELLFVTELQSVANPLPQFCSCALNGLQM